MDCGGRTDGRERTVSVRAQAIKKAIGEGCSLWLPSAKKMEWRQPQRKVPVATNLVLESPIKSLVVVRDEKGTAEGTAGCIHVAPLFNVAPARAICSSPLPFALGRRPAVALAPWHGTREHQL